MTECFSSQYFFVFCTWRTCYNFLLRKNARIKRKCRCNVEVEILRIFFISHLPRCHASSIFKVKYRLGCICALYMTIMYPSHVLVIRVGILTRPPNPDKRIRLDCFIKIHSSLSRRRPTRGIWFIVE